MPPNSPPDATFKCPGKGCTFIISATSTAAAQVTHAAKSETGQLIADRTHRKEHYGHYLFQLKLFYMDHINRQLSYLHLCLNSVSTTLAIVLAADATPSQRTEMNAVLTDNACFFRFKLKKGDREKKPAGNECRHLLWTPGLLLALLNARYGPPTSMAEVQQAVNIAAAQQDGAALRPPGVRPAVPNPYVRPAKRPRQTKRAEVTGDSSSSEEDPSPPPPAPAPSPSPAPAAANDASEHGSDCEDDDISNLIGDGDEEYLDQVSGIVGNRETALRAILTLLHMHLELATPWSDNTMATRLKKAPIGQVKGSAWAMAIRAHSGGVVGHYYCHVAFAHIQEILVESGHMMAGNDEVLEKGNHTIKEYKRLTFKGGTRVKGTSAFFRQRRLRLAEKATPEEEDTYTAVFVKRARHVGVVLQAGELQLAAELVTAQRKHTSITQSGAAKQAAAQRRVVTEVVKTETVTGLLTNTLPAPVSLPAPRAPPTLNK
jgi:hypothetical protein